MRWLLILFVAICGSVEAQKDCSIGGRAIDAITEKPLVRAAVTASLAARQEWATEVTDENGRFCFEGLPAGSYEVAASRDFYLPMQYGAVGSGRIGKTLALPDPTAGTIEFRLFKGAILAGTVTDEFGEPARMNIRVLQEKFVRGRYSLQDVRQFESRANGKFRAWGLEPGTYWIQARALQNVQQNRPELAMAYYPGTPLKNQATAITVKPGETREDLDFSVANTPMPRLTLRWNQSLGCHPWGTEIQRAENGEFVDSKRINDTVPDSITWVVEPGDYQLVGDCRALNPPNKVVGSVFQRVTVRGDLEVPLRLDQPVDLPGKVTIKGSRASQVTKLQVELSSPSGQRLPPVVVGADGKFVVPKVTPGIWDINAAPLLNDAFIESMILEGDKDVLLEEMAIDGNTRGPLEIRINTDGATVAGKLAIEASEKAVVILRPVGDLSKTFSMVRSTITQSAGAFRFGGLAPGKYLVWAFSGAKWGGQDRNFDLMTRYPDEAQELELKLGEKKDIQLKVIPLQEAKP